MKKLASYFIVDDGGGGGEVQYIPSDEAVRCAKAFLQDQLDAQSGVEFKVPSKDADAVAADAQYLLTASNQYE